MAVQANTRRRYAAAGSDALSAAHRNGSKIQHAVEQGGQLAKETAKVAEQHANKMVDSGRTAVTEGITRSEKVAQDLHEVVTASLPPEMVQEFPAMVQMINDVHDLQVQSAELLRRYIDRSIQMQRQALKIRTLPELSSLQQHYLMDNINDFAAVSRNIFDVSARVAQQCAGDVAQRLNDASEQVRRRARA
jgi:hypothetical protein